MGSNDTHTHPLKPADFFFRFCGLKKLQIYKIRTTTFCCQFIQLQDFPLFHLAASALLFCPKSEKENGMLQYRTYYLQHFTHRMEIIDFFKTIHTPLDHLHLLFRQKTDISNDFFLF